MAWTGFPFLDLKKWYRYSPSRNDEPIFSTTVEKKSATSKKPKKRPPKRSSTKRASDAASRPASPGAAPAKQPRAGALQAENVATQWPKQAQQQAQASQWIPYQTPDPAAAPERVDEQSEWPTQAAAYQESRFAFNQDAGALGQVADAADLEVDWGPTQEQQQSYQKGTSPEPDAGEPRCIRACTLVALFLLNAAIVVSIVVLVLSDAMLSWTSVLSTETTDTETIVNKLYFTPSTNATTLPAENQWHEGVDDTDTRYTDPHHQTACVFHASADGMASDHRTRFGISVFPFALCRLALFCCPPLATNLEPRHADARMSEFATRARRVNRFVQPLMMLGDGSAASSAIFTALLSDLEERRLAHDVGDWYKAHNYTGVVLRWPESTPSSAWHHNVAALLRGLAQRLNSARRPIRLGVALRQDSYGPDLKNIVSSLGQASIFLLPPAMPQNKFYAHTIRYYSQTTLDTLYSLNLRFLSRNIADHLCYLFPADTYTYRVKPPDTTQSLGPGIEGDVTKHAGRMAYFETCLLASTYSKHVTDYGVEALRADSFLAYTEPQLLGRFVDDLHKNASATCVGIWNPQMDDFGGSCGSGKYPLTSATFRFYNDTHH
ncbi:uncharacterized protein [Dermacentor albipictus]|uniref:uncharacterized protein isoform X2 n=1 Tax=Dermacentor albipictus TaxID=60249 RepID=UPI0031FD9A8E